MRNQYSKLSLSLVLMSTLATCTFAEPIEKPAEQQAERFAALEQTLTGCALVGNFMVTGEKEAKLKPERYELKTVKHVSGENWLFSARIKYGEHDVTLPLTLPVRWAGDTPVISLDKMMIPGFGEFTARVMIYAEHYAGFWSGAGHGGHMFGMIERAETEEKQPE